MEWKKRRSKGVHLEAAAHSAGRKNYDSSIAPKIKTLRWKLRARGPSQLISTRKVQHVLRRI
jgi:hypothetical protein